MDYYVEYCKALYDENDFKDTREDALSLYLRLAPLYLGGRIWGSVRSDWRVRAWDTRSGEMVDCRKFFLHYDAKKMGSLCEELWTWKHTPAGLIRAMLPEGWESEDYIYLAQTDERSILYRPKSEQLAGNFRGVVLTAPLKV